MSYELKTNDLNNYIFKHKKRGTKYEILHFATLEKDMSEQVVYQDLDSKQIWIRPAEEFFDGRFQKILKDDTTITQTVSADKELQTLTLVFENLEVIDIPAQYINKYYLYDYRPVKFRSDHYNTEYDTYDTIGIILSHELNNSGIPTKMDDYGTADKVPDNHIEYFLNRTDITTITLTYTDNTVEDIPVQWSDDSGDYCNLAQKNNINDNGDLLITIER